MCILGNSYPYIARIIVWQSGRAIRSFLCSDLPDCKSFEKSHAKLPLRGSSSVINCRERPRNTRSTRKRPMRFNQTTTCRCASARSLSLFVSFVVFVVNLCKIHTLFARHDNRFRTTPWWTKIIIPRCVSPPWIITCDDSAGPRQQPVCPGGTTSEEWPTLAKSGRFCPSLSG